MTYRLLPLLGAACLLAAPSRADDPAFSADRIKADVVLLASDRFEGRGPGTRGEELTTEHIASEFKKSGLKPAGADGTFFQPVPLVRLATSPKSTVRVAKGNTALDILCDEEFSGQTHTQAAAEQFEGEVKLEFHMAPPFIARMIVRTSTRANSDGARAFAISTSERALFGFAIGSSTSGFLPRSWFSRGSIPSADASAASARPLIRAM